MSNFEKIKKITKQLQFFIDEKLITENECGSVLEEIYSVMEILEDCGIFEEGEEGFEQEMELLDKVMKH